MLQHEWTLKHTKSKKPDVKCHIYCIIPYHHKKHWIACFKMLNFMVYELDLNKTVIFKNMNKITSQLLRKCPKDKLLSPTWEEMIFWLSGECQNPLSQLCVHQDSWHIHSRHSEFLVELNWFLQNSFSVSMGKWISTLQDHSHPRYLSCLPGWLLPQKKNLFSLTVFSSVSQSCLTLCDPMNGSTPGLPVHHQLPEFTQTHVHWVGDAI